MQENTVKWAEEFAETGRTIAMSMGHDEFVPTLFYKSEEGDATIVGLIGVPTGYMYDAVIKVVSELPGTPQVIALTCDAFSDAKEMEGLLTQEQIEEYLAHRIPLATRFANGDPNVKECLNTLVMTHDSTVTINQTYRWTPVDGWEWDVPTVISDGKTDWEWERLVSGLPRQDMSALIEEIDE